jgi:C-terminal processing protease CtpA/Prc
MITYVRDNSPASIAGLQKGDVITKIDNNPAYNFTLQKINSLLREEDENWVTLEIERDSQLMVFRIHLLNVL